MYALWLSKNVLTLTDKLATAHTQTVVRKPPGQKIKLRMTDKELLIASALGIVVFYFVTNYIRRQVTGTTNESKIKKHLRTITIIFAIAMTIQIISLVNGLLEN